MFKELIKKIELQSILVLFIALLFGYLLLKIDNSFKSPAGILGTISISFGILYTFGSFFSNQIRESYKDIVGVYETAISALKSSHKEAQNYIKNTMGNTSKEIGDYNKPESSEIVTQKE